MNKQFNFPNIYSFYSSIVTSFGWKPKYVATPNIINENIDLILMIFFAQMPSKFSSKKSMTSYHHGNCHLVAQCNNEY